MKPSQNTRIQSFQLILLLFTLLLIWGQSMMPPHLSSSESGFVAKLVYPVLSRLLPSGADLEHFVRKAGHFTEYFLLGLQLGFLQLAGAGFLYATLRRVFLIWLIAFLDETIQIFSGRGPQIQDVWLDLAGGVLGIAIVLLIQKLRGRSVEKNHA